MKKLIIFDWDDVFTLGSKEGYFDCFHQTLVELGIEMDPEEEKRRLISKWGNNHYVQLEAVMQENPELLDEASDIYEKYLFGDTFISHLSFVNGAGSLLERLNKDYTLAVATGAHPRLLREKIIPHFNIPDVFACLFTGYDLEDSTKGKPYPFMIEHILKELNFKPEDAVMVGDATADMKMAMNANVTPVAVLSGHMDRQDAEDLGIEFIIEDVTRLESVLERLNGN